MKGRWAIVVFLGVLLAGAGARPLNQPNVIFILADDMGYGDVRALNPKSKVPTPNMDRLATEGMEFTDAHSGSAVCTPTRYGVVTGRYCWRTRVKRGVLQGYSEHLIDPNRVTVADVFKQAGYATACIGKWHLGMDIPRKPKDPEDLTKAGAIKNSPLVNGFDYFFGVSASLDFPPYVFIENDHFTEATTEIFKAKPFPAYGRGGLIAPHFKHVDCLDTLTQKAVDYIKGQGDKPFFLYFPLTAPHKPVLPQERFRGKTKLGDYGDFVVQVDWTIGQILKTLDEMGLAKDTLVILTSDNGSFMRRVESGYPDHIKKPVNQGYLPENHTPNYIFRGTKTDIWEGGHHVPFLARWPQVVKPGTQTDQTICLTDFLATAAEITRYKMDRKVMGEDSFSFLPLLAGQGKYSREPVINHSIRGMFAIRDKEWKLVLGNGSGGRENPRGEKFVGPYPLYNLKTDIAEKTNVASQYPEKVQKMLVEFDQIFERTEKPVSHP